MGFSFNMCQTIPFSQNSPTQSANAEEELHIMDELEGIWTLKTKTKLPLDSKKYGQLNWDFMDWEEFPNGEGEELEQKVLESTNRCFF